MRKNILTMLLTALILTTASISYAGEIVMIGEGSTKESAIHNAMRLAIEKEIGVIIDNRTFTENHQLIEDDIILKSSGFVESYEVLKETQLNGIFEVEIKANVRSEELRTHLMSILQKRKIVDTNMGDPRIAVIAFDEIGNEYAEVENEIISGLQRQGFSRLIDLSQLDSTLKMRLRNSTEDSALRNSLINQFHVDYVVVVQVKTSQSRIKSTATLATRMFGVNTGEIIYAGSFIGNSRMFTNNTIEGAIQNASKRAAQAISTAALKKAAQVEQHITIIVTKNTLAKFGGNLQKLNERIKNLYGVNNVFTRNLNNGVAELDVNFDGTTYELTLELNRTGFTVIEMDSEYIKI